MMFDDINLKSFIIVVLISHDTTGLKMSLEAFLVVCFAILVQADDEGKFMRAACKFVVTKRTEKAKFDTAEKSNLPV